MSILNKGLHIGAVVIGRNEGQRLVICLESLLNRVEYIIYVDSGSSDNSLHEAESRGIECLQLDIRIPFTAARARNEGADYLLQKYPKLKYIQFVDGDCEIYAAWIEKASGFLEKKLDYAVVCGRRRERFPEQSIYNQLCDIEWDTPVGDALSCGGDAMMRVAAFKQIKGFREDLIAGEEPEMCYRLRQQEWKIYRLDNKMTLHDAEILKISQWWNRAKRAGYAYAVSCYLHGGAAEKFKVKEVLSIIFWAGFIPLMIVVLSLWKQLFLLLVMIYPLQIIRVAHNYEPLHLRDRFSWLYAISTVVAKWPQFFGLLTFVRDKIKGNKGSLIEYK